MAVETEIRELSHSKTQINGKQIKTEKDHLEEEELDILIQQVGLYLHFYLINLEKIQSKNKKVYNN